MLSCVFWPSFGGHSNLRVCLGDNKQGWRSFHNMLENFLSKEEYVNWFSCNHSKNSFPFSTSNTSYAEKVKSKKDNAFFISKCTSASLPCMAGRSKSKKVIGDASLASKSDNQGQWVIKNAEVDTTNFESL